MLKINSPHLYLQATPTPTSQTYFRHFFSVKSFSTFFEKTESHTNFALVLVPTFQSANYCVF